MKIKHIFLSLLFLAQAGIICAQFGVGIRTGYTVSTFSYSDIIDGQRVRLNAGSIKGAYYVKPIFSIISAQGELMFVEKGARVDNLEDNSRLIINMDYIEIPLGIRVDVPVLPIYVFAGIYTGLSLGGFREEIRNDTITKVLINFKEDGYKRFDFGYHFAAGYSKNLPPFKLFAEIRYAPGKFEINSSELLSNPDSNSAFYFTAGIQLDIKPRKLKAE
jgi:hypothetical protein